MNGIETLFTALGHAVLHFLWQGTVIALLAAAALAVASRNDSSMRHTIGLGALVMSLLVFAGTFVFTLANAQTGAGAGAAAAPQLAQAGTAFVTLPEFTGGRGAFADPRMLLAWTWIAGVLFMGFRHRRAAAWVRGLRRDGVAPEDSTWQRIVDSLCDDLGLRRAVRLLQSARIESPAVIGWLKPVIIVPVSVLSSLTPEELRCVLAHELAHIRRYDHLVNALLALIEVSLFFHPATWWLAGMVCREREHCCDTAAVRATGNPKLLARALAELESLRLSDTTAALAARSNRGHLMQRINRILATNTKNNARDGGRLQRPAFVLAGLLACAGVVQTAVAGQETAAPVAENVEAAQERGDQVRKRAEEPKPTAGAEKGKSERAGKAKQITIEDYKKIDAKVKKAIAEGKLTAEEGQAKLIAARKMIAAAGARVDAGADAIAKVKLRISGLLARMDTDKDGVITSAEAAGFWPRLAPADADKDGKVTGIEMFKAWSPKQADEVVPEKVIQRITGLLARMDTNNDGVVTSAEAGGFWPRLAPSDADKDGKLTKKEMIKAWSPKKAKVGANEQVMQRINGVLARMDPDKDGVVTSAEAGEWWSRIAPADADKDGKVTRKEMLEAWSPKQTDGGAEAKRVWAELEAMVAAGKITEAQAKERFAGYKKALAEKGAARDQQSPQHGIERIQAAIKRVQAAVEAGELTPAQGKQKIEALRKDLAEQKAGTEKKQALDLEKVKARVAVAVKSGRITVEQGKQRIEAYKKSLKKKVGGEAPKRP